MKVRFVFLILPLLLFFSCGQEKEIHFKETDFSDTSLFSRYILPQYSTDLMKGIRYDNIYRISISIDRETRKAEANLNLSFYNGSGIDLNEIHFRLLMNNKAHSPMKILSAEIGERPVEYKISDDKSSMKIYMSQKLISRKTVDIKISYTIDFSIKPAYYFNFARIDERGFSIPHFFPVAAVNKNGIWNNDSITNGRDLLSAESSWFMVEIITDDDVTLVTSGKEISREIRRGKQKTAFVAGPIRDFFICGDVSFIPQVTLSGKTEIISYSHNNISDSSIKAAGVTSSALALFNSIFGIYPYKEMKIAALPMDASGIEFSGLSAIKEGLYSDPEGHLFEPTLVHETAHQWFYSLMGNNQLRDPWIDEALAQYSVWLYYRVHYGASAALVLFNSFTERWDRVDREKIPINKETSFYSDREYEAIIYGRAPLFLIELRNIMGEREFHRFIRHLIKIYSYRQIDTETFRKELIHFNGLAADHLFEEYFD